MAEVVTNLTATPLGLHASDGSAVTVLPYGGSSAINPDMQSKQIIDLLVASGDVKEQIVNAPVNTAVPVVSGTAKVFETLTSNKGTWTNNPTSYTYQWYIHTAATGTGTAIVGETESTLQLLESYEGKYVYVVVKASNAGGSATAESARKGAIAPDA